MGNCKSNCESSCETVSELRSVKNINDDGIKSIENEEMRINKLTKEYIELLNKSKINYQISRIDSFCSLLNYVLSLKCNKNVFESDNKPMSHITEEYLYKLKKIKTKYGLKYVITPIRITYLWINNSRFLIEYSSGKSIEYNKYNILLTYILNSKDKEKIDYKLKSKEYKYDIDNFEKTDITKIKCILEMCKLTKYEKVKYKVDYSLLFEKSSGNRVITQINTYSLTHKNKIIVKIIKKIKENLSPLTFLENEYEMIKMLNDELLMKIKNEEMEIYEKNREIVMLENTRELFLKWIDENNKKIDILILQVRLIPKELYFEEFEKIRRNTRVIVEDMNKDSRKLEILRANVILHKNNIMNFKYELRNLKNQKDIIDLYTKIKNFNLITEII